MGNKKVDYLQEMVKKNRAVLETLQLKYARTEREWEEHLAERKERRLERERRLISPVLDYATPFEILDAEEYCLKVCTN